MINLLTEPPAITEMVFILGPEVIIGNTVSVQCTAFGVPAPDISWEVNGSPLVGGGRVTISEEAVSENTVSSTLLISNVALSDSGQYTCVADNGVISSASMSLQLIVLCKSM